MSVNMAEIRLGAGAFLFPILLATYTGCWASDLPVGPQVLGSDTVGTADLGNKRVYPLGVVDVGASPVPRAMAASADESTIYVISDKIAGQIILYDVETERRAGAISVSMLPLTSIVTSPDGAFLFVTSGTGKAQVERVDTATKEHTGTLVLTKNIGPLTTAVASPGANAILLGSATPGKGIAVVDAASYTELTTLALPESVGGLKAVSALADGSAAYFLSTSTPPHVIGVDLQSLATTITPLGAESNNAVSIVAGRIDDAARWFIGVPVSPSRIAVYDSEGGLIGTVNGPSGIPRQGVFDAATDSAIIPVSSQVSDSRFLEVNGTNLSTQTTFARPFRHLDVGLGLPGRGEMWFGEADASGEGRLGRFEVSRRARQGTFASLPEGPFEGAYSVTEDAIFLASNTAIRKYDAGTFEEIGSYLYTATGAIRHIAVDEANGRLVVGVIGHPNVGFMLKTVDMQTMEELSSNAIPNIVPIHFDIRGSLDMIQGRSEALLVAQWYTHSGTTPRLLRLDVDALQVMAMSEPLKAVSSNKDAYSIPAVDIDAGRVYVGFVEFNGAYTARLKEYDLDTLAELRALDVFPQSSGDAYARVGTVLLPELNALFFSGVRSSVPFSNPNTACVDLGTFEPEITGNLDRMWNAFPGDNESEALFVHLTGIGAFDPAKRVVAWNTPMEGSLSVSSIRDTTRDRLVTIMNFTTNTWTETVEMDSRKVSGIANGLSVVEQTGVYAYGASNPGKALIVDKLINNSYYRNKSFAIFDTSGRGYSRTVDIPLPTNDLITVMAFDDANNIAYLCAVGNRTYNDWTQIVRVDLADASVTASHVIGPRTLLATALALDPDSNSLLVWVADSPPRLLRLDADTLEEIESLTMPAGDAGVHTAVRVPGHNLALLAKQGPPGSLIRVQINPLQRLGSRTLSSDLPIYRGGLSVNPQTLKALMFVDSSRIYPFDATNPSLFHLVPPIMYGGSGSATGVGVTVRPVMGTSMWDVAMRGTHVFRLDGETRSFIGSTQPLPVNIALGGPAGLFPQPGRIQAVNRSLQSFSTSTAEQINLQPVSMPYWGVVSDVRVHSHAATGNLRVAIYQAGSTESLLWTSPLVANTAEDDALVFNIADGTPTSLMLSPGDYHLAWITDTHEQVVSHAPTGQSLAVPYPFLESPNRLPVQASVATNVTWTIYATYTAVPQPSLVGIY